MTDPPTLFDPAPLTHPDHTPDATITERFEAFHDANPHVYTGLVALARDLRAAGRRRIGVKMLFEVMRWSAMRTTGDDYRLNNSYTSRYARLIAESEPDLADAFETRELRAA